MTGAARLPRPRSLPWRWGTLQREPGRCYGVRMAFLGLLRRPRATDESKIVSDRRAGCSADGGHHARLVTIAARGAEPRASTAARPRAPSGTRPERAREMSTDSATVDRVVGLTAASRPRPDPQATRWCQPPGGDFWPEVPELCVPSRSRWVSSASPHQRTAGTLRSLER